ncbi:ROK family protein [Demequina oxidasica]|uniref:ROK family protein n=1 Tax=Demequina oxidasica TaxID=676199 RepID=UPI0007865599|nr:ROK family protein [Demequina oxidasica]
MSIPTSGSHLTASAGSRNEQTRRHNLSTLLTLVHHHGALSRAELTKLTGLNRSTIGALNTELAAAGFVFESAALESGTVGRPSPMVNPSAGIVALAINPDIDAIEVGAVGLGGKVLVRARRATDSVPTPDEALDIALELIEDVRAQLPDGVSVIGVGVAVPGLVETSTGMVTRAPHLGWQDVAWGEQLSDALGLPVQVGNDAAVAVVAVAVFGAGQGAADLMYLNGSASGIGGGVIAGGTRLVGANGFAGELGHTLVNSEGVDCYCGRTGCLETEVNLNRLQAAAEVAGISAADAVAQLGSPAPEPFESEVDREADVLAHGIANLISVFNPEAVVLGGFLGDLYGARQERIRAGVLADAFAPLGDNVRIERARLGDELLLVGAAELAFGPLLHDPSGWKAQA